MTANEQAGKASKPVKGRTDSAARAGGHTG